MKKIAALLLIAAMLFCSQKITVHAQENSVKVYLDGVLIIFDVQPQIVNDRTMVPLRFISEKLGATVNWDDGTKTATLVKSSDTIIVKIDSETMLVNQSPVTLDTPPIIIDSRTLVPLRAIAEAFHIAVNWDNEKFAVNIITGAESLFGAHTEKSFSLLNDLLKVDLPDFSQYYIAMPYGIMGPESSNEEETHIIIEKNGQKLALYVEELFNKASVNLGDDAKKILTVTKGIFESPVANGKVENVKLIPDVYEGDDGIIVRKALIRTQDNLLVYAAVFADPETFGETKDDCIKMAESIIDSIGEGTRQINRQPHEESLSGFTISLQQDYILTYQLGPDFSVYYIRKLVNVGEIQPYMGVYFGNFPSYDGTKSFIAISGKTLGQNINWHQEARTIDTDTQIETLVKINDDGWAQYMHIFVYPGTESDWNELKQMAESLTPEN